MYPAMSSRSALASAVKSAFTTALCELRLHAPPDLGRGQRGLVLRAREPCRDLCFHEAAMAEIVELLRREHDGRCLAVLGDDDGAPRGLELPEQLGRVALEVSDG